MESQEVFLTNDGLHDKKQKNKFTEGLKTLIQEWDQEARILATELEIPMQARYDLLAVIHEQTNTTKLHTQDTETMFPLPSNTHDYNRTKS